MQVIFAISFLCVAAVTPLLSHAAQIQLQVFAEDFRYNEGFLPPPSASVGSGIRYDAFDPLDYAESFASASLPEGTLKVFTGTFGNSGSGHASAGIRDTLTFALPAGMNHASVSLRMGLEGTTGGLGNMQGTAVLDFDFNRVSRFFSTSPDFFDPYIVTIDVANGQSAQLLASIGAALGGAGDGNQSARTYSFMDFSNTAKISLSMPAGVSFTSESGYFLSAVPEPTSSLLLLTGAWLLLLRAGRARGLQAQLPTFRA